MSLFERGRFTLASGVESFFKIECDALGAEDWDTLAYLTLRAVGPFGTVVGVPGGGLVYAGMLEQYADLESEALLIVDDVWTTGGSFHQFEREHTTSLAIAGEPVPPIKRCVVFNRGVLPMYVTALFSMTSKVWDA